ncbi:hypothetical protein HLB44_20810 [Aquincola sp. S2]|uniref:Uncharacterized protein n=1 Tax=Pseudaquabacterium terrae TaxID=2732868 RepID=A0ABX2ELK6_9BURK|nr:hypothetical protein [Aquabacterium terrae]NRF69446.1 hypothetical protein [Aquabacterium terrae]
MVEPAAPTAPLADDAAPSVERAAPAMVALAPTAAQPAAAPVPAPNAQKTAPVPTVREPMRAPVRMAAAPKAAPTAAAPKVAPPTPITDTAARRSASGSAAPETRDRDAELVAALMAHVAPRGGTAAASRSDKAAPPSGPAPVRTVTGAEAPLEPGLRARLDQRVQRCKQLNGRDAVVACRRRVCEQHWGRVAACPVKLMPAPAVVHAGAANRAAAMP